MPLDLDSAELSFALEALQLAARTTRSVQAGMAMMQLTKSDLSPVTVTDYACQALIAQSLATAFPDDVLVGEESSDALRTEEGREVLELVTKFVGTAKEGTSSDEVCDWIDRGNGEPGGRFWTLDPIDGTKGYLRGGQYVVALALIEDGEVLMGVLACPNLSEQCTLDSFGEGAIVLAVRGHGARRRPLEGAGELSPMHVSTCSDVTDARLLRSVEAAHTNLSSIDAFVQSLNIQAAPVSLDSQAKYALLAAGEGDVLVRFLSPSQPDYKEKIWDQAAGSIIVQEAGGKVTDLNGKPLDFTQGRTLALNTGVCATNALLHDRVLEGIAAI